MPVYGKLICFDCASDKTLDQWVNMAHDAMGNPVRCEICNNLHVAKSTPGNGYLCESCYSKGAFHCLSCSKVSKPNNTNFSYCDTCMEKIRMHKCTVCEELIKLDDFRDFTGRCINCTEMDISKMQPDKDYLFAVEGDHSAICPASGCKNIINEFEYMCEDCLRKNYDL